MTYTVESVVSYEPTPPEVFDKVRDPIAIGYVRVSTNQQFLSPEAQKESIISGYKARLEKTHRWYPEGEFFVDTAESASKTKFVDREAGGRADEILGNGDAIVVAKLDRAFRNIADMAETMNNWSKRGVIIYSANEGIDTGTAMGELACHIMGIAAQVESNQLSERLADARRVAIRTGQPRCGRAPLGFYWAGPKGQRYLAKHRGERYVMGKIVEWKAKGYPNDQIAVHLGKHKWKTNYKSLSGSVKVTRWNNYEQVHRGYWQEMFIRWLEQQGASFRDPAVIETLFAPTKGILREKAFREQLRREVNLDYELPCGGRVCDEEPSAVRTSIYQVLASRQHAPPERK